MLKNDVLVAKIGVDTAANEPPNVLSTKDRVELVGLTLFLVAQNAFVGYSTPMEQLLVYGFHGRIEHETIQNQIIDPLVPKDMFRLVCLVKLVFFAREGVAF